MYLKMVSFPINDHGGLSVSGLFQSSTGNVSDKYVMEITPASWTFTIWSVIYIYQAILLLYALVTLCLKTPDGDPLYNSPSFISPVVFFVYSLNLLSNIAWLIVWDREYLTAAFGIILFLTFSLYICIGMTMYTLNKHTTAMMEAGTQSHIAKTIAFVLNGLGVYAAWVSIATLLNMVIVLHYEFNVDQKIACTIFLGCLAFDAIVYACLDLVMFERQFRYVFTPYLVLHVALAGILYKNWDLSSTHTVFELALVCAGTVLLIIKVAMSIIRSRRDPLYKNTDKIPL